MFCVPTLADSQGVGAMLGVLCTYLNRQPRYGRYGGCSVYLPSQLTLCRAPSVVSVCVPTFSRQYGRYCGCFVYLPSQRTMWVPWWVFCVPACSANNMSAIVIVPCTYLLSRQCECHGRCSVYPPSRQIVLALLWVFSISYLLSGQYWRYCWFSVCLPSLQTILAPWC